MATEREPIIPEGDLVGPPSEPEAEKKTTTKREPAKRTTRRRGRGTVTAAMKADLESLRDAFIVEQIPIGLAMSRVLPITGKAYIAQSEELADALIEWGKTSPRIARILLKTGKVSGPMGVVVALSPVAAAAFYEMGYITAEKARTKVPEEIVQFIDAAEIKRAEEWPEGEHPEEQRPRAVS